MKKTTGLTPPKYHTEWDAIKELDAKYSSLLDSVLDLSNNVSDILTMVKIHAAKIQALEGKKKTTKNGGGPENV